MYSSIIRRKVFNTFSVTLLVSCLLSFLYMIRSVETSVNDYKLAQGFILWLFVYSLYVGAVILIYANLVSVLIELLRNKFNLNSFTYIILHGLVGALTGGVVSKSTLVALCIAGIAILYALVDYWQMTQGDESRSIKYILLISLLPIVCSSIYFATISEPLAPFTAKDAIASAIDDHSITSKFPHKSGKVDSEEKGYYITRETRAKKIIKNTYSVRFIEKWSKDGEKGEYRISYEITRNSLTLHSISGEEPPYYNK
ncbi:hypothetical protein BEH_10670 [Priestia filamentosa]|uniref:Uncharacterized protein n=1 Tax=Priestia filamentosa TaxID=1402861 RepID=A0A1X7E6J1_9BACI|nr:hypothetical protein [Priestia filamentosa]AKO92511.1 hypothetical protein BEH_10670 [Priestia filamentosa]MDT3762580.1 hypothetical protein [Priestia filamentosa]OXS69128.1 hypothetical protein B1B01_09090 [Priestia filamentosa]WRU97044.1 hypothetical protein RYX51_08215 [Priestia filamentosa]SMF28419.1 hypothetical protein SAMN06296056_102384 [Priestia filamentosa]